MTAILGDRTYSNLGSQNTIVTKELSALKISTPSLVVDKFAANDVTTGTLQAITGIIDMLEVNEGTILTLTSDAATIDTLDSTNGTIATLESTSGTITTLDSTTSNITTANITTANITTLNATNFTLPYTSQKEIVFAYGYESKSYITIAANASYTFDAANATHSYINSTFATAGTNIWTINKTGKYLLEISYSAIPVSAVGTSYINTNYDPGSGYIIISTFTQTVVAGTSVTQEVPILTRRIIVDPPTLALQINNQNTIPASMLINYMTITLTYIG